jgi:ubiquinone/menaquinone biosynthesis C-methylase UbiE
MIIAPSPLGDQLPDTSDGGRQSSAQQGVPFMMLLISKAWNRFVGGGGVPDRAAAKASSAPTAADGTSNTTRLTSIAGNFYPYFEAVQTRVVPKLQEPPETSPDDGLPIPPRELHAGYGFNTDEYLISGRNHHGAMMEIIQESGFALEPGGRILDFGCAAGRVTRCFKETANHHEVWGVDIRAEHIFWCQRNLSPPFRFATTTTHPHLPFEDNFFSLIYACSVFTHIGDLEDAWLLELRRVLRPDGRLFVTVHDNHTIDLLLSCTPGRWPYDTVLHRQVVDLQSRYDIAQSGFSMASLTIEPGNHQVFHDREYLRHRWGQFFTIQSFHPEGHGFQTAVVMSK